MAKPPLSRSIRNASIAVALAVTACFTAVAQPYPAKPITFVVPAGAGGPTDIAGRLIGQLLSEELKVPVIVENKTGAGLTIGTAYLAKAKNDGYTIGIGGASSHAIPPGIYRNLPYDVNKDFAPVSLLFTTPMVLVASPAAKIDSVASLIAQAKASPGKINYASGGNGTLSHLSGESLKVAAGIDIVHVPYKGSAPANTDLMGGQVQLMFQSLHLAKPFITSGKLVALGLAGPTRSQMMPELPTLSESGLGGFAVREWYALFAPAGTPKDVIARLNNAVIKQLKAPAVQQRYSDAGLIPTGSSEEEAAKMVRDDSQAWAKIITQAGIKLE